MLEMLALSCVCFLGATTARPAHFAAEAPERICLGETLPQIWRVGGKKGIFLHRNEAICCPAPFSAAGRHPFL